MDDFDWLWNFPLFDFHSGGFFNEFFFSLSRRLCCRALKRVPPSREWGVGVGVKENKWIKMREEGKKSRREIATGAKLARIKAWNSRWNWVQEKERRKKNEKKKLGTSFRVSVKYIKGRWSVYFYDSRALEQLTKQPDLICRRAREAARSVKIELWNFSAFLFLTHFSLHRSFSVIIFREIFSDFFSSSRLLGPFSAPVIVVYLPSSWATLTAVRDFSWIFFYQLFLVAA